MAEANRYDVVHYPSKAYAYAHPDRLHVLATLFGMEPAPVATARVLELGCGSGGHLLPLAWYLPQATFVGIDGSEAAIRQAQALASDLRLPNLRLQQADILDLPEDLGTFDYILCHGVYSWVPDAVREQIHAVFARHLAPQGVAYVSYNALPGWHLHQVGREILRWHGEQFDDPEEQVEQGRALLHALAEGGASRSAAYATTLVAEQALMSRFEPAYYFHDFLAPENTPFRLVDVVRRAKEHGLAYLGDALFGEMLPLDLSDDTRALLERLAPDLIRREQYLDLLRGTSFRRSLFVHDAVALERGLTIDSLRALRLDCSGQRLPPDPDGTEASGTRYKARGGAEITVDDRLAQAVLDTLIGAYPATVALPVLLDQARAAVGGEEEGDALRLGGLLIHAYGVGLVDLIGRDRGHATTLPSHPRVTSWARLELGRGDTKVCNTRHELVALDRFDRELVRLADGSRDVADLAEGIRDALRQGRLEILADGRPTTDPEILDEGVTHLVARRLHRLLRAGLLDAGSTEATH